MARAEMHEGRGEQRQAHGGCDARPSGTVAPAAAERDVGHGRRGEYQEADGDQLQGRLVQRGVVAANLPEVHAHRDTAQGIAAGHQRGPGIPHRDMQQHRRQQAQHRETRRHHQVENHRRKVGAHQHNQRAEIPGERKSRGQPRKKPALHARPPAPAEQQRQKDGENEGAGGMAQNVDQQRLVESEHRLTTAASAARRPPGACSRSTPGHSKASASSAGSSAASSCARG